MKYTLIKLALLFLLNTLFNGSYSQKNSLPFDVNKDPAGLLGKDTAVKKSKNPFKKFIGQWTLKDNNWSQNWGQGMEHIKIPNHHTICRELNTDNSLLAVVDGTPPYGHIFWSYNPVKKEVNHLSSFGTSRSGVGKGTVNENGDVTLKVSFEGEPEGSYRIYTYKWISDNEYDLKSIQYNDKNEPTGYFYGGIFVRISQKK